VDWFLNSANEKIFHQGSVRRNGRQFFLGASSVHTPVDTLIPDPRISYYKKIFFSVAKAKLLTTIYSLYRGRKLIGGSILCFDALLRVGGATDRVLLNRIRAADRGTSELPCSLRWQKFPAAIKLWLRTYASLRKQHFPDSANVPVHRTQIDILDQLEETRLGKSALRLFVPIFEESISPSVLWKLLKRVRTPYTPPYVLQDCIAPDEHSRLRREHQTIDWIPTQRARDRLWAVDYLPGETKKELPGLIGTADGDTITYTKFLELSEGTDLCLRDAETLAEDIFRSYLTISNRLRIFGLAGADLPPGTRIEFEYAEGRQVTDRNLSSFPSLTAFTRERILCGPAYDCQKQYSDAATSRDRLTRINRVSIAVRSADERGFGEPKLLWEPCYDIVLEGLKKGRELAALRRSGVSEELSRKFPDRVAKIIEGFIWLI